MRTLHGYYLLIVARKITKATVWHYSTGNDMGVCGADSGPNAMGYTDTETATTLKGCCLACSRYVGKHGDYQGWDSENGVRFLSITNPRPSAVIDAYKGGAFCAMHGKFISQCAAQHNNDSDSGFRETDGDWFCDTHGDISERCQGVDHTPAKKSGFPVATPQETEMHIIGAQPLTYPWWNSILFDFSYLPDGYTAPDNWRISGTFGDVDDDTAKAFTVDHASILRAIRAIAKLDPMAEAPARRYVSGWVIKECRTWVFKGPDETDFDAPMADEVLQYAVTGEVIYA